MTRRWPANITNEGGAEGRYRVLKNIMGLWLLQRVLQERQINDLPALIAATQALPACRFIINPNDDRFINPDDDVQRNSGCVSGNGATDPGK